MPPKWVTSTRPSTIFDPWSGDPVRSWAGLQDRIDQVLDVHGSQMLMWRGVTDASWGLYSSLYRRLKLRQAQVTESDMVAEELLILQSARRKWRFDHLTAIELLAHIQHYGGPTRLLDVTANPLIAAWFASEQKWQEDGTPAPETDARIFCFYAEPVGLEDWGGRDLRWHDWSDRSSRVDNNWGTGNGRRVWRPPAYNERISAQNGAFILDGVPFSYPGANTFTKAPGDINHRWKIDEVRDASSIPIKLNDHSRARQRENAMPAFTFRIAAEARKAIRERLEMSYGYDHGSLYSDLFGLAQYASPTLPSR